MADPFPETIPLLAAWRGALTSENAEAGFGKIREITGTTLTDEELAAAIAACLARKEIYEPVRLPEGALQCHWTLELTPAGVAATRALLTSRI
jgi:hypothetical protein